MVYHEYNTSNLHRSSLVNVDAGIQAHVPQSSIPNQPCNAYQHPSITLYCTELPGTTTAKLVPACGSYSSGAMVVSHAMQQLPVWGPAILGRCRFLANEEAEGGRRRPANRPCPPWCAPTTEYQTTRRGLAGNIDPTFHHTQHHTRGGSTKDGLSRPARWWRPLLRRTRSRFDNEKRNETSYYR